jgi:DNA-binding NarL/FixJ family response regulator
MGPLIVNLLMQTSASRPGGAAPEGQLTPREREVLALVAEGNTERNIGARLGLSPKTVHVHRTSIMSKLGTHNAISLLRRALQLGLIEA